MRNGIGDGSSKAPVLTGSNLLEKLLGKLGYVKEVNYCADCREIRYFKAKRLDDLERIISEVPGGAIFKTAFVAEHAGRVITVPIHSKAHALNFLTRVRKGHVKLVF